ncbi:MAG TPA: hypothetical protein ENJ06_01420 [Phycisphaeraceae bacterium]|nr:hypothetical protein [Phycisphaeraceae bacterium]
MSVAKKIILVVGPLVLIVMLILTFKSGPKLPNSRMMVDIRTGAVQRWPEKKITSLPAKSPKDGKRVMLPVVKGEDGKWYVPSHYLGAVRRYYEKTGEDGPVDIEHNGLVEGASGS